MTSLLDVTLFELVSIAFAMILIFVIVYGFLKKINFFGDNTGLAALIGFAFSVLTIANPAATTLILFLTPWFFTFIFIGFFALFILMMFGLKEESLTAGKTQQMRTWVIIILVVLGIFGLGGVFGQSTLEAGGIGTSPSENQTVTAPAPGPADPNDRSVATDDFATNVLNTVTHPSVLGFVALMLIGVFTLFLMTRTYLDVE